MPIETAWDNSQKTIIRQTFTSKWTWDELYTAADTVTQMLDTVAHPVHLLMDMQNAPSLPNNALAHIRLVDREHRNQGKIIAIGLNTFIQTMFRVVIKIRPQIAEKIIIVATLAEAYTALNSTSDSSSQP